MFFSSSQRRAGFTIWELLAVIAVILVILCILSAGMGNARQAAMKNTCRNSIRQIALALCTREEAKNEFPTLYFRNRMNDAGKNERDAVEEDPTVATAQYPWTVSILPYLQEMNLYNQMKIGSNEFTNDPATVNVQTFTSTTVAAAQFEADWFRCAASTNDYRRFTPTNYVIPAATKQQLLTVGKGNSTLADGIVIPGQKGLSIANVRDGVSKTFLLTESNEEQRSNWYHWQQTFVCGFLPGDTSVQNNDPKTGVPRIESETTRKWIFNLKEGDRTALMSGVPRDHLLSPYNSNTTDPLRRTLGPSSEHAGNVVVHGNVDSSIREILTPDIDPKVYYSAITRDGNEGYSFED